MVYNVRGMKVSADNWDVCADQSIKRELIRLGFADKGGLFCFNARKKTAAVVDARCFYLPDKALGLAARLAQVRNVAVYVVTGEEEAFISASRLAVLRGGRENAVFSGCALPGRTRYAFCAKSGKIDGDYARKVYNKLSDGRFFGLTYGDGFIEHDFFDCAETEVMAPMLARASCAVDAAYGSFVMINVEKHVPPFTVGAFSHEIFRDSGFSCAHGKQTEPFFALSDATERCLCTVADPDGAAETLRRYSEVING